VDSDNKQLLSRYDLISEAFTGANGRLNTSQLTEVQPNKFLRPDVAQRFQAMAQAARADGVNLQITDAYRSYEQQVDVARRKGLYSQGGLAAYPGTSNHGWGTAVDLNVRGNPGAFEWLKQNASQYGFTNIPREPWHWEVKSKGQVPPVRVSPQQQAAQSQLPPQTQQQQFQLPPQQFRPPTPLMPIPQYQSNQAQYTYPQFIPNYYGGYGQQNMAMNPLGLITGMLGGIGNMSGGALGPIAGFGNLLGGLLNNIGNIG